MGCKPGRPHAAPPHARARTNQCATDPVSRSSDHSDLAFPAMRLGLRLLPVQSGHRNRPAQGFHFGAAAKMAW